MTAEHVKTVSPDDIDLLVLAEKIIAFIKRYKWLFIFSIIAGLLSGFLFYRSLAKIYHSGMIFHSFMLTNAEEIQIADNWNDQLRKKEYTALAQAFHCPEKILYPVRQIKASEIQKVFTPNNPSGFTVEVNTTDNSILPALRNGLVYGFENSPYVRQRTDMKRARLEELIRITSLEIGKLDSTKIAIEKIISGNGRASSSVIVDGSNVSRQLVELNEKLLSFRDELKFSNSIQVLQDFSPFKTPAGPHLLTWLFAGLVLFISLAWTLAMADSLRRKLRHRAAIPG